MKDIKDEVGKKIWRIMLSLDYEGICCLAHWNVLILEGWYYKRKNIKVTKKFIIRGKSKLKNYKFGLRASLIKNEIDRLERKDGDDMLVQKLNILGRKQVF